jgi:hypothetical protein
MRAAGVLVSVALVAQVPATTAAIVAKLTPPMEALARLAADERLRERLDDVVQRSPAAASLGTRWTRDLPAWTTARAAVGKRLTLVTDAYVKTGELRKVLQSEVASLSADDADKLKAALDSPAGGLIIRQQAMLEFVTATMSGNPNGPSPGQPEWTKLVGGLRRRFESDIGPAMPADDPTQRPEADKFLGGPLEFPFQKLWMGVIGKAEVAIEGAMNLLLFDDRAAILKDIAAAVATVK